MPKRRRVEGSAPLRLAIAWREEARQAIRWIRGGSVQAAMVSVVPAESTDLLHPAQEQQLVELLERPMQVRGGKAADEGRETGCFSR